MISLDELPKRDGVELVDLAGVGSSWPMPVALWDAPRGFDTRSRPDNQPCHVIALRLSGGLVQRVGLDANKPERLRPNGFSIHPAQRELRFFAPTAIRFAHLYLNDSYLRAVSTMLGLPAVADEGLIRTDRVMYEDTELTSAIDMYVRRAFADSDRATKFEMESRANLIVLSLLKHHRSAEASPARPKGALAPWQVRRICMHLEQNIDRSVSLEELSKIVGVTTEHLCRAFRRATGHPPLRWQLQKRMEMARTILLETDASLTSIAQELGYAGQSAFGTAFREAVGMSPGEYRRTARPPSA